MMECSIPDWLSAISAAVSTIAVVVGLLYAKQQLAVWKAEARQRRRADAAESLLASAHEAADLLRSLRSSIHSIPAQEVRNKGYVFEQRLKRLGQESSIFEELRKRDVVSKFIMNNPSVNDSVKLLFDKRLELQWALEDLFEASDSSSVYAELEELKKLRRVIFRRSGKDDLFEECIAAALRSLESLLGPIARYEEK